MTPRRPPSLLLIDDDEGTSGLLHELFHGDGYEVAVAGTKTHLFGVSN